MEITENLTEEMKPAIEALPGFIEGAIVGAGLYLTVLWLIRLSNKEFKFKASEMAGVSLICAGLGYAFEALAATRPIVP